MIKLVALQDDGNTLIPKVAPFIDENNIIAKVERRGEAPLTFTAPDNCIALLNGAYGVNGGYFKINGINMDTEFIGTRLCCLIKKGTTLEIKLGAASFSCEWLFYGIKYN